MSPTILAVPLKEFIEKPYIDLEGVIQGLIELEKVFFDHQDRRAIFATAYLSMTRLLKNKLDTGVFRDSVWVSKYAVSFCNLYRLALLNFEQGDTEAVPKAWKIAFDTSIDSNGYVILDLLLGINAHINHDLAIALQEVSIDPNRDKRHEDHTAVNVVLREAIDPIQDRISKMYAPGLALLDSIAGSLDESLTRFSFEKARECAWAHGLCLTNARNDEERISIQRNINDQSATLARLMRSSVTLFSWFRDVMRSLEGQPAWTLVLQGQI